LAEARHISRILINGNLKSLHADAWDTSIVLQKEEQLMSLSISAVNAFKLQLQFLQIINCRYLIDSLLGMYPEKPADPTIVATICEEVNFRICRPQTLEFGCRYFPSRDTITMSMIHHKA
jgi:hypothetical protein